MSLIYPPCTRHQGPPPVPHLTQQLPGSVPRDLIRCNLIPSPQSACHTLTDSSVLNRLWSEINDSVCRFKSNGIHEELIWQMALCWNLCHLTNDCTSFVSLQDWHRKSCSHVWPCHGLLCTQIQMINTINVCNNMRPRHAYSVYVLSLMCDINWYEARRIRHVWGIVFESKLLLATFWEHRWLVVLAIYLVPIWKPPRPTLVFGELTVYFLFPSCLVNLSDGEITRQVQCSIWGFTSLQHQDGPQFVTVHTPGG